MNPNICPLRASIFPSPGADQDQGRSPYEAPILTESGDFILGQYAHEFDNTDGYTQQYNERGHPQSRASRAAARELRRAKNDVLSTVGVVYKKATPTHSQESDDLLVRTVNLENKAGFTLFRINNFLTFCSLWWLSSLRRRVMTFDTHSLPLIQIAKSELRVFGTTEFLFAGLPACLVVGVLSSWCQSRICKRMRKWLAHHGLWQIPGLVLFLLDFSVDAFSTLQSLHLIPAGQNMSMTFLIPFTNQSPIQLPTSFIGALTCPFLLWVSHSLHFRLQKMVSAVLRVLVTKPDKPDRISCLALQGIGNAEARVPGLREPPGTLSDEIKFQSSELKRWFRDLLKPFSVRRQTAECASSHLPDTSAISPRAQNEEGDLDRASTATPDPHDLFDINDIEQQPDPESEPAESEHHPLSRTNTLFTPLNQSPATTSPVSPRIRASLIHQDAETVTMRLELLDSQRGSAGELRNRGLEAAVEVANNSQEVAADQASTAETTPADVEIMVSELGRADQERDDEDNTVRECNEERNREEEWEGEWGQDRPRHRVTALSNFSAAAFASHAARLISTAALLPLEALCVRSLASAFLRPSPLAQGPLFRPWSGLRHHGNLVALLGIQAVVSSALWGLGTGVAIALGRIKYGWGKL